MKKYTQIWLAQAHAIHQARTWDEQNTQMEPPEIKKFIQELLAQGLSTDSLKVQVKQESMKMFTAWAQREASLLEATAQEGGGQS